MGELTNKQIRFCREYVIDWNGSRAAVAAGYSKAASKEIASRLLTKANVKKYIDQIKEDYEQLCGISKMKILAEHYKLAFTSIAHLHNTWIERKEFEQLTDDQKACIAEIDTKTRREYNYNPETQKKDLPIEIEYIRIKLYDKQKALDSIAKLMGYDAPTKVDVSGTINLHFDKTFEDV